MEKLYPAFLYLFLSWMVLLLAGCLAVGFMLFPVASGLCDLF